MIRERVKEDFELFSIPFQKSCNPVKKNAALESRITHHASLLTETALDIEDWRDEIDRIDEHLIDLLNRRSKCAIEIGRIKRERDLPVYLPARETEVINHVIAHNSGPLGPDAVRRLFERIIDESRHIERVTMERELEEQAHAQKEKALASKRKRKKGKR